ncbi:Cytochrome P450 2J6 [Hypsibius exemplaris]|uniref:Cytochrome P450 2J6 n=1 Tax=Hypsibius exemplaris TaxID=2072580 RepID=A0A1W0X3X1_HYPEX|nr:Cytochrome P450 2J6 [Hypsibius exemplaris]
MHPTALVEFIFSADPDAVLLLLTLPFICYWALCKWRSRKLRKSLPPSPFQLPLVGCLPFLDRNFPHLSFSKWADRLGKIYSCRMGTQLVVVLNESPADSGGFRSALLQRPTGHVHFSSDCTRKRHLFAPDHRWQIHRKFALKTFKMLGIGRNVMEEKIHEEAHRLVQLIAGFQGRPFCNKNAIRMAMSNVICHVVFGKSFHTDSAEVHGFYEQMNLVFRYFGVAGILNIFPGLIVVPAVRASFAKVTEALNSAAEYITEMFEHHLATFDSCAIRDYTDAFIEARLKEKVTEGSPKLFSDKQYVAAARELFLTGYESTTATARWAFLYTASNAEVQKRVQEEIDHVVGRSRIPCYSDAKNMPYTEAVLCEVLRIACVGPMGVPHRATEDTELAGYRIPKDAWIFTNLWHVHRDSKVWQNSDSFIPERFLSADGLRLEVPKLFMPFSAGKRSCLGESLAKMQIFSIFTTVLQNFRLSLVGQPDFEPINGITLDTKDYQMTAVAR